MAKKIYTTEPTIVTLVNEVRKQRNAAGGRGFVKADEAKRFISMEGYGDVEERNIAVAVSGLTNMVKSSAFMQAAGFGLEAFPALESLAQTAAVVAADVRSALTVNASIPAVNEFNRYVPSFEGQERVTAALEAFDEASNRDLDVYTIAYNISAPRQDEFGETLFPTMTVAPGAAGFTVSLALNMVMPEVRRNISGVTGAFKKNNLIQAYRDSSLLNNNATDVVPVVRTENAAFFVSSTLYPVVSTTVNGVTFNTAPLVFGKEFDLLTLSQNDTQLAKGSLDNTASLDKDIRLKSIVVSMTNGTVTEVFEISTVALSQNQFFAAPQGLERNMLLNFDNSSIKLDTNFKKIDGTPSTLLATITAGTYVVRMQTLITGKVNMETGATNLVGSTFAIANIKDASGTVIDSSATAFAATKTILDSAKLIGFTLTARKTNSDLRERGLILDVQRFNQVYGIPLLGPITAMRPVGNSDTSDTADLQALVEATRIRTSNNAVDTLVNYAAALPLIINSTDAITDNVEALGIGRWMVTPFYESGTIDVSAITQTLDSADKDAAIMATLVSRIRDVAYRAYRDSGLQPAIDTVHGTIGAKPVVIIATDPVLQRWLMVNGDLRTLGDFDFKIVASVNKSMIGKIFVTFGSPKAVSGFDPLHFGNMAWKAELTMNLPLYQNGATSKHLMVQPSFRHIVNLPILAEFTVSGITALVSSKTAVNFHTV